MTIECYFWQCKNHSFWDGEDDGPFCFLKGCVATEQEIKAFGILRKEELMRINKENVMLKEEFDTRNLGEELAILRDLEAHYRDQVQILLTEGKDDEAMKWDKMANDMADQIDQLKE